MSRMLVARTLGAFVCMVALAVLTPAIAHGQTRQPIHSSLPAQDLFLAEGAFFVQATIPTIRIGTTTISLKVPAGMRYVIEYFSARAEMPTGQMVELGLRTTVTTVINGVSYSQNKQHYFVPANFILRNANHWYVLNESVKLYASAGTAIVASALRSDDTGHASVELAISGYLEPEPE